MTGRSSRMSVKSPTFTPAARCTSKRSLPSPTTSRSGGASPRTAMGTGPVTRPRPRCFTIAPRTSPLATRASASVVATGTTAADNAATTANGP